MSSLGNRPALDGTRGLEQNSSDAICLVVGGTRCDVRDRISSRHSEVLVPSILDARLWAGLDGVLTEPSRHIYANFSSAGAVSLSSEPI